MLRELADHCAGLGVRRWSAAIFGLDARLGYLTRQTSITVARALPLDG